MTDDDEFRAPPQDVDAERSLLGAMLLSPEARDKVAGSVRPEDFYRPAHELIFRAIRAVRLKGEAVDVVTVNAHLTENGEIGRVGGPLYVHGLVEAVPMTTNAAHYAAVVRERASRRALIAAGTKIVQMGYATDGAEAHGLSERAVRMVEQVRDRGMADEDITTVTVDEFLQVPEDPYDWIVPGLLERGDRLMLTGMEGLGKSTLFRQIAVCTAAGIHPFTGAPQPPKRVLMVDVENSPTQIRRRLRPMVTQAKVLGHPIDPTNLWLDPRSGMDLADDRDVSWLMRRIAAVQPDVLCIGPLYRLAPRALNSDDDAAPIIATLNMARDRGCCVLVEAHSGHAAGPSGKRDIRPRGSSAFMGWPEFGYGIRMSDTQDAKLRRLVDLIPWRGDREERGWPQQLEAGGQWPWTEAYPQGFTPTTYTDRSATA